MKKMSVAGCSGYLLYAIVTEHNELVLADYIARSSQEAKGIGANIMRGYPVEIEGSYTTVRTRSQHFAVKYNYMHTSAYSGCPECIVANTALQENLGKGEAKETKGLLLTTREDMDEKLYHAFMFRYDMPLLREWMPHIREKLQKKDQISITNPRYIRYGIEEETDGVPRDIDLAGVGKLSKTYVVDYRGLSEETLERTVSDLLKSGTIWISKLPQKKMEAKTMDEYIAEHGKDIVANLRDKAKPNLTVDGTWPWSVNRSRRLFASQADCVSGMVDVLERGRYCVVNEGMGCGKTLQSMDAVEGYMVKKYMKSHHATLEDVYRHPEVINYRVIVMAPGHLVGKWKEEIESQIPGAKAVILNRFDQLLEIKKAGRKCTGRWFYIIGKDFGKLSYSLSPIPTTVKELEVKQSICAECGAEKEGAGITKCLCGSKKYKLVSLATPRREEGLVCPECGELLFPAGKLQPAWDSETLAPLTPADFSSQTRSNDKCWYCGCKLWKPLVANLGAVDRKKTWYKVKRFTNAARKSTDTIWVLNGREYDYILKKGGAGCESTDDFMETKTTQTRKVSPLQYIHKHMKQYFDFAILDEVHKYKGGGSAQGIGAGWVIQSAKKTLALTGTLSGGKAEDLFYILFRLDPKRMLDNGFGYNDVRLFSEQFGCREETYSARQSEDDEVYNSSSRGRKVATDRVKPGVSPVVFTKFLIDKAVFLDLKDMSNQLPPLNEIIVGVDLESDIRQAYEGTLNKLKQAIRGGDKKLGSQMVQFALSYPDKPYGRSDILSPMDGRVAAEITNLDAYKGRLTNKEEELIRIVRKEIEEGRSLFVYAEYTGNAETNITPRLAGIIEKEIPELQGKVSILDSASPDAEHRMDWIKERAAEGKRVIVTNPKLCECGLDFIFDYKGKVYNYNTIIQYQMGYDLFVLWQSVSRHYRLIQTEECRTYYLYSRDTIQLSVLQLMAQKKNAVSVLQGGGFSSEGLSSMASGINPEAALAKALSDGIGDIEEEVINLYTSKEEDTSEQYASDFKSHLLYHELLGIPEEEPEVFAASEQDLFQIFDGTVIQPDAEAPAQKEEVPEVCICGDLFELLKNIKISEKSKSRKQVAGQFALF